MAELASDNFDRANSADIGANWTPLVVNYKIVSNRAEPSSQSSDAIEMYDGGITWPDDQYAQVTTYGTGGLSGGSGPGVILRARDTPTTDYYRIVAEVGSPTNSVEVAKIINGTWAILPGGLINVAWASGDVLRAEIVGSTITVYKNGLPIDTRSDSQLTSGKPGIGYSSTQPGLDAAIDNWSAGDFVTEASAPPHFRPAMSSRGTSW